MHHQTIRAVFYSALAILLLAFVWGFRQIPENARTSDRILRESLDQELTTISEAVRTSTQALKYKLLDVLKSEGSDYTSRAFQDSPFMAATLLQWDQVAWKPLWYSVKSKTDLQSAALDGWMKEWPLSKLLPDETYFAKVADLEGQAYFAILVSVRRPQQTPMIGVGIFPAQQFGVILPAVDTREIRVFNDQSFALALSRPAYLGTSLRQEPFVGEVLDRDEASLRFEWKGEHGTPMIGFAQRIAETNLYAAIQTRAESGGHLETVIYLILCGIGAIGLNWFLFILAMKPILNNLSQAESRAEDYKRQLNERPAEGFPRLKNLDFDPPETELPTDLPVLKSAKEPVSSAATESSLTPAQALPRGSAQAHPAVQELVATSPLVGSAAKVSATAATRSLERIVQAALTSVNGLIKKYNVETLQFGLMNLNTGAEARQLQTVVEEVLKNAVESMSAADSRLLTVSGQSGSGRTRLTIEDTGCGIPEDNLEKVFDPFFSTKDSQGFARGLGLNVVRRVIEELEGNVTITSAPGGTRVQLDWPDPGAANGSAPTLAGTIEVTGKWPEVAIRKPKVVARMLD